MGHDKPSAFTEAASDIQAPTLCSPLLAANMDARRLGRLVRVVLTLVAKEPPDTNPLETAERQICMHRIRQVMRQL